MLLAAHREKDTDTEKHSARLHISILAGRKVSARTCAVGDTGAKDRYIVDAGKRGSVAPKKWKVRSFRRLALDLRLQTW
jgi:hypothetical protein